MKVTFDSISEGKEYSRKELAKIWSYKNYNAIRRGIVRVGKSNIIIIFITKEKTGGMTPYKDFYDGKTLRIEGEEKHGSDYRLSKSRENKDQIHLFYREKIVQDFTYCGEIKLQHFDINKNKPSEFTFEVSQ